MSVPRSSLGRGRSRAVSRSTNPVAGPDGQPPDLRNLQKQHAIPFGLPAAPPMLGLPVASLPFGLPRDLLPGFGSSVPGERAAQAVVVAPQAVGLPQNPLHGFGTSVPAGKAQIADVVTADSHAVIIQHDPDEVKRAADGPSAAPDKSAAVRREQSDRSAKVEDQSDDDGIDKKHSDDKERGESKSKTEDEKTLRDSILNDPLFALFRKLYFGTMDEADLRQFTKLYLSALKHAALKDKEMLAKSPSTPIELTRPQESVGEKESNLSRLLELFIFVQGLIEKKRGELESKLISMRRDLDGRPLREVILKEVEAIVGTKVVCCDDHETNALISSKNPLILSIVGGGAAYSIADEVTKPWVKIHSEYQGQFLGFSTIFFSFSGMIIGLLQLMGLPNKHERERELQALTLEIKGYMASLAGELGLEKLEPEDLVKYARKTPRIARAGNVDALITSNGVVVRRKIDLFDDCILCECSCCDCSRCRQGCATHCCGACSDSYSSLNSEAGFANNCLVGYSSLRREMGVAVNAICCSDSENCYDACCPVYTDTPPRMMFAFAEGLGGFFKFLVEMAIDAYCDPKRYPNHYQPDPDTGIIECEVSDKTFGVEFLLPAGLVALSYGVWHSIDPAKKFIWGNQNPHARRLIKIIDFISKWIFHAGLSDGLFLLGYSIAKKIHVWIILPTISTRVLFSIPMGLVFTAVLVPDYDTNKCCNCYKNCCAVCGRGCAMQPKQVTETSFTFFLTTILGYIVTNAFLALTEENEEGSFAFWLNLPILILSFVMTAWKARSHRDQMQIQRDWQPLLRAEENEIAECQVENQLRPLIETLLSGVKLEKDSNVTVEKKKAAEKVDKEKEDIVVPDIQPDVKIKLKTLQQRSLLEEELTRGDNVMFSEAQNRWRKFNRAQLYFNKVPFLDNELRLRVNARKSRNRGHSEDAKRQMEADESHVPSSNVPPSPGVGMVRMSTHSSAVAAVPVGSPPGAAAAGFLPVYGRGAGVVKQKFIVGEALHSSGDDSLNAPLASNAHAM